MLQQLRNLKKRAEGFTIVEVMIVLAIAGLILLIVFLAVPALQRNSRNTAIKNDAQNLLGGVSEYAAANNGAIPGSITVASGTVTYACSGNGCTSNSTSGKIQANTTVATGGANTTAPTVTGNAPTLGLGAIQYKLGYKCGATPGAAAVATSRAVAVYYAIETSGTGVALQCVDS